MGAPKLVPLLLLLVAFAFAFPLIRTESEATGDAVELEDLTLLTEAAVSKDSGLEIELEQLRSKISFLESRVDDSIRELKTKDGALAEMEKLIHEKSNTITLLQSEIDSIQQKRGNVDSEELLEKAQARAYALEKQIEKLRVELQTQSQKKDDLEARATRAENTFGELSSKLKNLQSTNAEQKQRLQKIERSLKVSEEELLKAKLEVVSKKKMLKEVHGAWLPPWLATHLHSCQKYAGTQWNQHGQPALGALLDKVATISVQVQKYADPHMSAVKDRWLPAVKEQWASFVENIEPHVQLVSSKTLEFCEASVTTMKPHVVRVQELAYPYFQEAKKHSKPYVDQLATFTKPHVEKIHASLKPHIRKVSRVYRKFLKSVNSYHQQVQAAIYEQLKKYELTRTFATKELVWFLASAFVAVPLYVLVVLFASSLGRKTKKSARGSHTSQTHRKHKRRHPENKIQGVAKM